METIKQMIIKQNQQAVMSLNIAQTIFLSKKCTKCGEVKSLSEFHKNKKSKDGRRASCRDCFYNYYKDWTKKRGETKKQEARYRWMEKNKKKQRAGNMLRQAVNRSLIVREPCEVCNNPKTVGHHDDYDNPLAVRWLCEVHHSDWHLKNGEGKNG